MLGVVSPASQLVHPCQHFEASINLSITEGGEEEKCEGRKGMEGGRKRRGSGAGGAGPCRGWRKRKAERERIGGPLRPSKDFRRSAEKLSGAKEAKHYPKCRATKTKCWYGSNIYIW